MPCIVFARIIYTNHSPLIYIKPTTDYQQFNWVTPLFLNIYDKIASTQKKEIGKAFYNYQHLKISNLHTC